MTKSELMKEIYNRLQGEIYKTDIEKVMDTFISTVEDTLAKGERVQIIGFGTFEARERKCRDGRNPRKPEETIHIPAYIAPVFKAGQVLKDAVNK